MFEVRFTNMQNGKVTSPTVRDERDANYVYGQAKRVATALFKVELLIDGAVVKEQMVGA